MSETEFVTRHTVTGTEESAARVQEYATKIKAILGDAQQAIDRGVAVPMRQGSNQVQDFASNVTNKIGIQVPDAFRRAFDSVNAFTTGLTGASIALGAFEVARFANEAHKAFASVQEGQTRVKIATGASADQIEELSRKLKQIEAQTGIKEMPLLEGILDYATRTKAPFDELLKSLPMAAQFAHNTQIEVSKALQLISSAQKNLKISPEDMQPMLDGWLQMGRLAGDFEKVLGRLGPTLRARGLQGPEVGRDIASIYQTLIESAPAGPRSAIIVETAMERLFTQIYSPTARLGREMRYRGVLTGTPSQDLLAAEELLRARGAMGTDANAERRQAGYHLGPEDIGQLKAATEHRERLLQLSKEQAASDGANARVAKELSETEAGRIRRRDEHLSRFRQWFGQELSAQDYGTNLLRLPGGIRDVWRSPEELPPTGPAAPTPPKPSAEAPQGQGWRDWLIGRRRPKLARGGIVGENGPVDITAGEEGVEAIIPLTGGLGGGGGSTAVGSNTRATEFNTEAVSRLTAALRPISDRAERESFGGATGGGVFGVGGWRRGGLWGAGAGAGGAFGGEGGGGGPGGAGSRYAPGQARRGILEGRGYYGGEAPPGVGAEPGDVEGRPGSYGGAFNVPAGTPETGPRTTITLKNGEKVTVGSRVAEQWRGFYNDLIDAGAPVKGLGGFGTRGNPSQHPIGYATDWTQRGRNVVAPQTQQWISQNQGVLNQIEQKWGISGGEHWSNPDTGHFSIQTILGTEHLARLGMGGGAGTGGTPSEAQAYAMARAAAVEAGSPDPDMTAALMMHESGWLKRGTGSVFDRSGGTNPFGQTGVGPAGSVMGRDRQRHKVYTSMAEGVRDHLKRWGEFYGRTPAETLENLRRGDRRGGYNRADPGWAGKIAAIRGRMAGTAMAGADSTLTPEQSRRIAEASKPRPSRPITTDRPQDFLTNVSYQDTEFSAQSRHPAGATEQQIMDAYIAKLEQNPDSLEMWMNFKNYFDSVPKQEKEGPLYGVHRAIRNIAGIQQFIDMEAGFGGLNKQPGIGSALGNYRQGGAISAESGMSLPETAIVESWLSYIAKRRGKPFEEPFLPSRPVEIDPAGRLRDAVRGLFEPVSFIAQQSPFGGQRTEDTWSDIGKGGDPYGEDLGRRAGYAGARENLGDYQNSVVDMMKLAGMDSSARSRRELADALGYKGPNSSAQRNVFLRKALMDQFQRIGEVPSSRYGVGRREAQGWGRQFAEQLPPSKETVEQWHGQFDAAMRRKDELGKPIRVKMEVDAPTITPTARRKEVGQAARRFNYDLDGGLREYAHKSKSDSWFV